VIVMSDIFRYAAGWLRDNLFGCRHHHWDGGTAQDDFRVDDYRAIERTGGDRIRYQAFVLQRKHKHECVHDECDAIKFEWENIGPEMDGTELIKKVRGEWDA